MPSPLALALPPPVSLPSSIYAGVGHCPIYWVTTSVNQWFPPNFGLYRPVFARSQTVSNVELVYFTKSAVLPLQSGQLASVYGCELKYGWFICLCVYLNRIKIEISLLIRTSDLFMRMGHIEFMCRLISARVKLFELFHTNDIVVSHKWFVQCRTSS
jgi:hypothetical protein